MELEINWLAVIVAFAASMGVAMTWYSERGLGKAWEKQTGITTEMLKKAQGRKPFLILFVANFATTLAIALAIAVASAFFKDSSVWLALIVGFVLWLGLSASTLLQHNTFEMKASQLTAINNGYQLTLFLVIAVVIGLF